MIFWKLEFQKCIQIFFLIYNINLTSHQLQSLSILTKNRKLWNLFQILRFWNTIKVCLFQDGCHSYTNQMWCWRYEWFSDIASLLKKKMFGGLSYMGLQNLLIKFFKFSEYILPFMFTYMTCFLKIFILYFISVAGQLESIGLFYFLTPLGRALHWFGLWLDGNSRRHD